MNPLVGLVAFLVERFVGYPKVLEKYFAHPVVWMGAFIAQFEAAQNRPGLDQTAARVAGAVMLALLVGLSVFAALVFSFYIRTLPFGWVIEALVATVFLSQRQLGVMVGAVGKALGGPLTGARAALQPLVGRDVGVLDAAGVGRAAIETLAENSSDGVIAPLFWLMIFGLPGAAAYKAINTADSMVGHLNDRYQHFGWASARLDDLVNWVPARITAALYVLSALFVAGGQAMNALRSVRRDARLHLSPNAGWPEAAVAGALGLRLGGPRTYAGEMVDLAYMGNGRAEATADDVRRALDLYEIAMGLALLFAGCVVMFALQFA